MKSLQRILLLLLLGIALPTYAQDYEEFMRNASNELKAFQNQAQTAYNTFHNSAREEYEAFRNQANKEYADFMRQSWDRFDTSDAKPIPVSPEPPRPVVRDPNAPKPTLPEPLVAPAPMPTPTPEAKTAPKPEVKPAPKPEAKPAPKPEVKSESKSEAKPAPKPAPAPAPAPAPKPASVSKPRAQFTFDYYGTKCVVSLGSEHRFTLSAVNNGAIADAWEVMSSERFYAVADEMEMLRQNLQLCDWGYVKLTECATKAFFGAKSSNEARLMQIFFLTQSGFKVRIGYADNRLLLMMPSTLDIPRYSYIALEGSNYYILNRDHKGGGVYLYDREFPNERSCSMSVTRSPLLTDKNTSNRRLSSKKFPNIVAEVAVNSNLIDFYSDFPVLNDWDMYVNAPINKNTGTQFYKQLQKGLAGVTSKYKAADMLLNFVQTAFDYKTDGEQFGNEKPFFPEEMLYYPYSDCEDRAILYAALVRDLLGLDVVLLHYPNHLATAVCFNEDVVGSYIMHNGKRYFVCDPTYIGASVGEAMPNLDNSRIEIVEID